MERDLTQFHNIVYKKMSNGFGSKEVKAIRINDDIIIWKMHKYKEQYINEKNIYIELKDEDFLPKLKYFDDKHLILGLTDVGDSIQVYKMQNRKEYNILLGDINKQIKYIVDKLLDKYGLYHNDLQEKNICIDNNKIVRFIDFQVTGRQPIVSKKKDAYLQKYVICKKL